MKKVILYIIIALPVLFSSCKDYLDVESDSKFGEDYVYSSKTELDRVLTGVYASVLSGDLYGEKYLYHYALNSDVEFSTFTAMIRNAGGNDFKCFDGESHSGDAAKTWAAAYEGVERANLLIYGITNSPLYDEKEAELMQMLGEGKTLRAMLMLDLVILFGDVPFPKTPTFHSDAMVAPIEDRNTTLTYLINDLKEIAPKMKYANQLVEGVERVSREFSYSLIARMALTRGGYSLRPDKSNPYTVGSMQRESDYKEYYAVARDYADSVIMSGTHALNLPFVQVFIDQCNYKVNNGDDPIFELPFVKNKSGIVGYRHGPRGRLNTNSSTSTGINVWGESAGSIKLSAFYRYSFDKKDLRRNVSVGLWEHNDNGDPAIIGTGADYTHYANKWSKFWADPSNSLGTSSRGNTGFNFPYMRYADVLLMYAEAVNELEEGVSGQNGEKAKDALKQVRKRAFAQSLHAEKVDAYVRTVSASKETFFKAIFNERKWEFGGENIRWKDLVRWNLYSKAVYDTFWDYYQMGSLKNAQQFDGWEYYEENFPQILFPKSIDNPKDVNVYQNQTLKIFDIIGLGFNEDSPNPSGVTPMYPFEWGTSDGVYPRPECCYSLRGYIRGGAEANYRLFNKNNLPPVRYLLPIPRQVILLSHGAYSNYYGY